jgi:hypothetical protein
MHHLHLKDGLATSPLAIDALCRALERGAVRADSASPACGRGRQPVAIVAAESGEIPRLQRRKGAAFATSPSELA